MDAALRRKTLFALSIAAVFLSAYAAQGQTCSVGTTIGRYAVVCDGYLTPGPNTPLLPAKELATVTADANGNFQSTDGKISIGGAVVTQTVSGTENLNHDCTGTITFSQTINGQPAPPLNIAFVVRHHGEEIDGLAVDPGSVFSCRLSRLH